MDEAGLRGRLLNSKPGLVIWMTKQEYNWMINHIEELIAEREKTHGSFGSNADMWQTLCNMFKQTQFKNDSQRLAANMIFLKLARMSQNPGVEDHWDDIAGYAKLGSQACK